MLFSNVLGIKAVSPEPSPFNAVLQAPVKLPAPPPPEPAPTPAVISDTGPNEPGDDTGPSDEPQAAIINKDAVNAKVLKKLVLNI